MAREPSVRRIDADPDICQHSAWSSNTERAAGNCSRWRRSRVFRRADDTTATRRGEALLDAKRALDAATSLREIQHIVRTTAAALTGADGATVVLRDGDRCFY